MIEYMTVMPNQVVFVFLSFQIVMEIGGVCFLCAGLPLVVCSDEFIARWPVIVTYFLIHGMK